MEQVFVTTDGDYWNSSDELHFYVRKGEVKALPEVTTDIVDTALQTGLLREATADEIVAHKKKLDMEEAIRTGQFQSGANEDDTLKAYDAFLAKKASKAPPEPKPIPEPKEAPAKAVIAPPTEGEEEKKPKW